MKAVYIYGKGHKLLEICDCETDDLQTAFNATQSKLTHISYDMGPVYSMECEDVSMLRYDTCIQVWAGVLNKEYLIDGMVFADSPQLARNVCQLQANAILDLLENQKFDLKLMGISLVPKLDLVN